MIQALPGFRDFYPADSAARRYVFEKWRETARRYGFVEVDGPTLESVELYKKKSGGELVGQLFNFVDKGEREVALRPEMTPTLARMVAARDREFKKPIKWFSIANFFRYEKQQKGRLREFTQFNCDLIGEAGAAADSEMIALTIDLFRAFGLTADDFFVRINDRNVWLDFLVSRGVDPKRLPEFLAIIDKVERAPAAFVVEAMLGFDLSAEDALNFAHDKAAHGPYLQAIEADLETRGLRSFVDFDRRIVRGLAYYTGVVFEVFDRAQESRALAGGGRYDELIGTISDGTVKHPALGFAIGDVTLLNLLRATPHAALKMDASVKAFTTLDAYIVIADETLRPPATSLANALRAAGKRIDLPLSALKARKQYEAAETLQAQHLVIFEAEHYKEKLVTVRKLNDRFSDTLVLLEDLLPYLDGKPEVFE